MKKLLLFVVLIAVLSTCCRNKEKEKENSETFSAAVSALQPNTSKAVVLELLGEQPTWASSELNGEIKTEEVGWIKSVESGSFGVAKIIITFRNDSLITVKTKSF